MPVKPVTSSLPPLPRRCRCRDRGRSVREIGAVNGVVAGAGVHVVPNVSVLQVDRIVAAKAIDDDVVNTGRQPVETGDAIVPDAEPCVVLREAVGLVASTTIVSALAVPVTMSVPLLSETLIICRCSSTSNSVRAWRRDLTRERTARVGGAAEAEEVLQGRLAVHGSVSV